MSNLVEIRSTGQSNPSLLPVLTPVSERGVWTFFEGLAAVHDTTVFGAPAAVGIAITPSLFELLRQYCGSDPRFAEVMANIWQMEHRRMKEHSISAGDSIHNVWKPAK